MADGFVYDDGGRTAAGFKGSAGDCVVRAIAIATGKPYREVYDALAEGNMNERRFSRSGRPTGHRGRRSARNGVTRKVYEHYLFNLGFKWVPTMQIGSGCKVHLLKEELPKGTLIVRLSKHLTAVINGVIHDTYNPQRGEFAYMKAGPEGRAVVDHISPERCVYGYYQRIEQ
jgi:hypothetical protein